MIEQRLKFTSLVLLLVAFAPPARATDCASALTDLRTDHAHAAAYACANVDDLVRVMAPRPTRFADTLADDVFARLIEGRPEYAHPDRGYRFDPVELANGLIARLLTAWADRDQRSRRACRPEPPFLVGDDLEARQERRRRLLSEDAKRRVDAIEREYRLLRLYPLVVRALSYREIEQWQNLSPALASAVIEAIRGGDLSYEEYISLATVAERRRPWTTR